MSVAALESHALRRSPGDVDGIRRVQVGCGPHHIRSDWWNTDVRPFPGIDEIMDATLPWPWQDVLDFVYAEHFLEHLQINQAIAFLTEAGRALRAGGTVRISTPSLEWVLLSHFSFAPPDSPRHFDETLNINRAFHGWGHKFLYSKGVLRRLFDELGYADIIFCRYGHSDTPDLNGLELHESGTSEEPFPNQWIVEARKGTAPIGAPAALLSELDGKLLTHMCAGH